MILHDEVNLWIRSPVNAVNSGIERIHKIIEDVKIISNLGARTVKLRSNFSSPIEAFRDPVHFIIPQVSAYFCFTVPAEQREHPRLAMKR